MNAKRKAAKVQETGQDELTEDENAQLAAEGEGMGAPEYDTGTSSSDAPQALATDTTRPGQAPNRDDPTDTAFRASQGTGAGAASGTWKPAEPTPVMSGPDIPEISLAEAKPGYETVASSRVPGMGDPQNGVVLTDWTQSPIAWVNPRWPTHQPNSGPPPTLNAADDARTRERMGGVPGAGEPGEPGAPGKDIGQQEFGETSMPPPIVPHPDDPLQPGQEQPAQLPDQPEPGQQGGATVYNDQGEPGSIYPPNE